MQIISAKLLKSVQFKIIIILLLSIGFYSLVYPQNSSGEEKYEIVIVGSEYKASSFARFFTGDHYRDLWITPIKVPVLDLNNFAGGLTPTKRGGGLQTFSLHFIGENGKKYKFRSIDKDVARSLPPDFKESIVADAMQDQVSVTNPVSAVVVAPLMDAVNILNAKPLIFLMPDDERLAEYRSDFKNLPGTIEENPDDYENEQLNFAGADKIVGTFKLYEKLQEDNDESVDAAEFLKARLLDILIGDRDRHAGQWKWAGYKTGKKRIWKPIPKDRDFAFPLYDGLFPRAMTVAITSMVHFDYDMPSMLDMTWEGRHLDRRLLSTIDKSTWDSVANFMQIKLTDEVIENAVHQLPEEYFGIVGEEMIAKLKSRRDQLKKASDEFYNLTAKYVDIYLSDKQEFAEVSRVNNLFTEVTIYKRDKNTGDKKGSPIYHRIFKNAVTDEIRIHLMGGDDFAIVTGEADESCRVIIEGGKGKDELYDNSIVNGYWLGFTPFPALKTKTEFYDSGKKSLLVEGEGTYINTAKYEEPDDPQKKYEPLIEDRYHDYQVLVPFEYNTDDGFILGIGGRINYYDFRKKPFAHRFDLTGSYATISKRAEFEFLGEFNDIFENLNVKIPAKFTGLEITRFYGFGNETVRDDKLYKEGYYDVNQRYFSGGFYLKLPLIKNVELHAGLLLEFIRVLERENKLISELQPYGLGFLDFFALSASLKFDSRDDNEMPGSGNYLNLYGDVYPETLNNKEFFGKIVIDGRTYLSSFFITDFTIALRAYSEIVWGEYPFYKGASIGGKKTFRGFARDRFIGDYAFVGSADMRFYLGKVFLLIPFKLGMNIFTDAGRVFLKGENSNKWHNAFGAGLWVSINEKAINFSLNIAKSPETLRFYISIGQMF